MKTRPIKLIFALIAGGLFLRNLVASRRALASFTNPQFTVFAWSELPPWVVERLAPLRGGILSLGFTELVCYSRRSGRDNFTAVLTSPDRLVTAHVWVARSRGLRWALTLLAGWRAFRRDTLGSARYAFVTEYPNGTRFETSPIELLESQTARGELEFEIVPEATPLAEALRRHEGGAAEFAARVGVVPIGVTDREQFFDLQRTSLRRMVARSGAR